jgi:hypothetical protein
MKKYLRIERGRRISSRRFGMGYSIADRYTDPGVRYQYRVKLCLKIHGGIGRAALPAELLKHLESQHLGIKHECEVCHQLLASRQGVHTRVEWKNNFPGGGGGGIGRY